ncbi:MAG: tRNA (adenosine(37)-N6)-threonylcarbamoyltransferase complex dimerization subunit type 1 TsaB, partial [Ornithinibacter sp.]
GLPTAGRGPLLHPDVLTTPAGPLDVDAAALARLGATGIRQEWRMPVEPLYLRRPDALTTAERGAR